MIEMFVTYIIFNVNLFINDIRGYFYFVKLTYSLFIKKMMKNINHTFPTSNSH